ncbi:MAG: ATP-binding protein [Vulcanimicrobiaceae bacterium]
MTAIPQRKTPGALPTGAVTFVFTDVEGSAQRWDRDRAPMERAIRRHDELIRAAIDDHGGHVFKTIGDAFCAVFNRPEDAVAAILGAQRALGKEDFSAVDGLRVRAAIHTGTADERGGDYFGPAVNRVARLLAIGHGGQVLVSGVTADLVQGELPSQASLRDLGEHRLKDLARPEYVYQLLAPDLTAEFPPLRSLESLPNNLPSQMTSFIGRDAEIAEITTLVEQHRLVTLTGSGGVGKTRASLQVAANMLDGSGDGVWLIELAPLSSGDYIPSTVAQALGIKLDPEGNPAENLAVALKSKQMLLVFDSCEHLVEAASQVIGAILHRCPKIKVLASSRQGLGLQGEAAYRMPSLTLPDSSTNLTTANAATFAAVALFAERASAADNHFALTDENAPMIADICRRLDGIPLAIELAASRVKMLSPRQLRERLDERFRVLTGGSRDTLPRQQTLRAMIDWSHDLLDERERVLFRRLGIFANGFTLEGAVAVGSGEDLDELDVFDVLASLVDKSLVLAETDGDSLRYRLLESTRAYALEKLSHAGERDAIAGRHLTYLRDRFVGLWDHMDRTARTGLLTRALITELDDVRSALDGALQRGDIVEGGELLAASGAVTILGLEDETAARCEAFLIALGEVEPLLRTRLLITFAGALDRLGRGKTLVEVAAQALDVARSCGDGPILAAALHQYATSLMRQGRLDDNEAALSEAEAIPGLSPRLRLALSSRRGNLQLIRGDYENAATIFERLIKEHRSLGNTDEAVKVTLNLGEVEHGRGRTERAIALAREALPLLHGLDAVLGNANLTGYLISIDDLAGTMEAGRATVAACETDLGSAFVAMALEHVALAHALGGDLQRAATLEGYSATAFVRHGFLREGTETKTYERLTALLKEGLATEEIEQLSAAGAALEPNAAIALALGENT